MTVFSLHYTYFIDLEIMKNAKRSCFFVNIEENYIICFYTTKKNIYRYRSHRDKKLFNYKLVFVLYVFSEIFKMEN